ncbi:hypothetical protein FACS189449_09010 [Alphaproteobacteria bacterium]|nr:hypothetical protein FACS189449_09010 [Alphaproteobacteria bacterium]
MHREIPKLENFRVSTNCWGGKEHIRSLIEKFRGNLKIDPTDFLYEDFFIGYDKIKDIDPVLAEKIRVELGEDRFDSELKRIKK